LAEVIEKEDLTSGAILDVLLQFPDESMKETQIVSSVYCSDEKSNSSYDMKAWTTYITSDDSVQLAVAISEATINWSYKHKDSEIYDISVHMGVIDQKDIGKLTIYYYPK
jgi:hypothetical protein